MNNASKTKSEFIRFKENIGLSKNEFRLKKNRGNEAKRRF